MRVLAIETATPASSVAIGEDGRLAAMSVQVDRRGHVGFLGGALDFCFHRVGWQPSDLDAVIVDVGPGLFSGIRAGLATAEGIAAAVGVPVMAATSLDALAYRAATGRRTIWPVVDARRGEVAVAPYQPVPGGVAKEAEVELWSFDEFRGMLESSSDDHLIVGDWEALPSGFLRGLHRVKTGRPRYPSAEILLELAEQSLARSGHPVASVVRPLYLRSPDTAINWTTLRREGLWPDSA